MVQPVGRVQMPFEVTMWKARELDRKAKKVECRYCGSSRSDLLPSFPRIIISEGQLCCYSADGKLLGSKKIQYCPMCGEAAMIVFLICSAVISILFLIVCDNDDYHNLAEYTNWLLNVAVGSMLGCLVGALLFFTIIPQNSLYKNWSYELVPSTSGAYYTRENDSHGSTRYAYYLKNRDGSIGSYSVYASNAEIRQITDKSTPRLEQWTADTDWWHRGSEDKYILYVPGGG